MAYNSNLHIFSNSFDIDLSQKKYYKLFSYIFSNAIALLNPEPLNISPMIHKCYNI